MNEFTAIKHFLDEAAQEGLNGMRKNLGGPFGAVIVKDGTVIGRGCNMVTSSNDPTAHAEVSAIRDACKKLGTFNLEGATLFSSTEPCPMCLSAVYWAGIKTVYYATDRDDAEKIGFSDKFIYDELSLPNDKRSVKLIQIERPSAESLFAEWRVKEDKTKY